MKKYATIKRAKDREWKALLIWNDHGNWEDKDRKSRKCDLSEAQ